MGTAKVIYLAWDFRVLFVYHLALLSKKVVGKKKKKTTSVTETRTNLLALQKVDPTHGVCVAIS